MVELNTPKKPALLIPPPKELAEFPEIVESIKLNERALLIPPPSKAAEFPVIMELVTLNRLLLKIPPPPSDIAEFPIIVELMISRVPLFRIAPPAPVEIPMADCQVVNGGDHGDWRDGYYSSRRP